MADLACGDCGHNVLLHDGQGCTVSSCDCTTPPAYWWLHDGCVDCGHNVRHHDGLGCGATASCACTTPMPAHWKKLLSSDVDPIVDPSGNSTFSTVRLNAIFDQLASAVGDYAHQWAVENRWRPEVIAYDPDIDSCEMTFEERVAWHGLRDQLRRMQ